MTGNKSINVGDCHACKMPPPRAAARSGEKSGAKIFPGLVNPGIIETGDDQTAPVQKDQFLTSDASDRDTSLVRRRVALSLPCLAEEWPHHLFLLLNHGITTDRSLGHVAPRVTHNNHRPKALRGGIISERQHLSKCVALHPCAAPPKCRGGSTLFGAGADICR